MRRAATTKASKIISLAVLLLITLALPLSLTSRPVLAQPSDVWVAPPPVGSDSNPGTEALPFATIYKGINSVSDNGTVHVAAGTYHEFDLHLQQTMNLIGAGASNTIIDGDHNGYVIEVSSEPTQENTISGFTIQNGAPSDNNTGGGIYISASHIVEIYDCAIINNIKGDGTDPLPSMGGGVCNDGGALYMEGCTVSGNTASGSGGGIYNRRTAEGDSGLVELIDCTIKDNEAEEGGGIYNEGVLFMYGCTVSGNSASEAGGGIFNVTGTDTSGYMIILECTISGNRIVSAGLGGGIANQGLIMEIVNCTVANNTATDPGSFGGGFYNTAFAIFANTIVANNSAGTGNNGYTDNVTLSLGYNLDSENSCGFDQPTDLVNTDPLLGPLQDNGGLTFTHALLHGSPAIDSGECLFAFAEDSLVKEETQGLFNAAQSIFIDTFNQDTFNQLTEYDQRGVPRPQGASCDIGAYELAQASVDTATGTGTTSFSTLNGYITDLTSLTEFELDCPPREDLNFPNGLFSFKVVDITPGSTVTIVIILPSNMPTDTQYWKCLNGQWVDCTSLLGSNNGDSVLTLTITDGDLGDLDEEANGEISDPGGPAVEMGVIQSLPASPRVSPTLPRPLNPSQMSLQYLSVSPQQTYANQPVTITTNVVNTGDEAGNLNVTLKINGQLEQSRMVSVGPQGTQPVKFTVTKAQPGTYNVDILGKSGSFTILGAGSSTSTSSGNGGLIVLLIIGVLVLATVVVLILFRRPA